MKNHFKLIVIVLLVTGISCKDQPESKTPLEENVAATPKYEEHCYVYAKNKDTITVLLTQNENLVLGKISYNFFEKDASIGSFEGIIKDDTIFGDYEFKAEGRTSKRELIFLKKENTLLEGYGDVEVVGDSMTVFKSNAKITFDENFPLTAVSCDQLNF